MSNNKHKDFTTQPVSKLIYKIAVPSTVSMLITALYNIADAYFVGQINTPSTAAIGISFSVMALIMALGNFYGAGAGNYISRALGAKDVKNAHKMANSALFYCFSTGVIIGILGVLFLSPIARILGSTESIQPYTEDYLRIIFISTPFMAASFLLNNQLRFQGNANKAMIGVSLGAVLNIALDPLFIFTFNLGITGAALATALSQFISFLLLIIMHNQGGSLRLHPRYICLKKKYIVEIFHGGFPSLSRQILASIATILLNVTAGRYGDSAIAAMTIVTRITFLIFAFQLGLGQGFQPVCGFNYGAKLYNRVLKSFWFSVWAGTIMLSTFALFGAIYAPELMAFFRSDDKAVIEIGTNALRYQLIIFPLVPFTTITNMLLQNIRLSGRATFLASARQGLFFIPLILILPHFYGLMGVEICQAVADLLTFIIAIPVVAPILKKIKEGEQVIPV